MAVVRRNILEHKQDADAFVEGVQAMKAEPFVQDGAQLTTADLSIPTAPGTAAQPLSTYDIFVLWHHITMMTATPTGSRRNAAHQGPVFLPWHRLMLTLMEANIARVLGRPDFGLPYWDWAADGDKSLNDQLGSPLWEADLLGGDGDPDDDQSVTDGPFGSDSDFRVRIWADSGNTLWAVDRPLQRRFAPARPVEVFFPNQSLPRTDHVSTSLPQPYDAPEWDFDSAGFRNTLEGWLGIDDDFAAPNLHNRVHVWISGDMDFSTSPNDPAFYLNHCNVDRIWSRWQAQPGHPGYQPGNNAPASLLGHRPSDPLLSVFQRDAQGTPWLVSDMFNVSKIYSYDTLD